MGCGAAMAPPAWFIMFIGAFTGPPMAFMVGIEAIVFIAYGLVQTTVCATIGSGLSLKEERVGRWVARGWGRMSVLGVAACDRLGERLRRPWQVDVGWMYVQPTDNYDGQISSRCTMQTMCCGRRAAEMNSTHCGTRCDEG